MRLEATVINGDVDSQKLILQANIPFTFLYDKVRFTHMKDDTADPLNDDAEESNKYYQRRVDPKRIESIKNHIREAILNEKTGKRVCVLFPTALLLAASDDKHDLDSNSRISIHELLEDGSPIYIVDGQHRMQAMIDLYNDLRSNSRLTEDDKYVLQYLATYKFNCSILLNFDLWEQAQIFADVNFKQRKVDKSLYYAIYGLMEPNSIDDIRTSSIFIAHSIVKYLNTTSRSPLNGMIKMLRNGKGYISQSFFADSLIRNLQSTRGIWYSDPTTVLEKVPCYASETIKFFQVIKELFPNQWPKEGDENAKRPNSLILKTNAVGALLRLMVFAHQSLIGKNQYDMPGVRKYLDEHYSSDLKWLISPLKSYGEELFGINSAYSGSGGKGLEAKLYKRMIEIITASDAIKPLVEDIHINSNDVKVKIYRDSEGIFSFSLSHYFKNPDQMNPYIPGGGSMAGNMYHLRYRLRLYIDQVSADATIHKNEYWKPSNNQ